MIALLGVSSAFMAPAAMQKLSMSKFATPVHMGEGGKGFGGGEATRDPAPTSYDPNDPKGKQQAIHKAESFAEYLAKRNTAGAAPAGAAEEVIGMVAPSAGMVSDFTCTWLSPSEKAALKATADAMSAPHKGFLASDESAGPWLRAGHVDAAKVEDSADNRAAYRSMLYQTPGLSEHISGVILHWETLFQSDAAGNTMVDLINGNGMIPGIKLDKGYDTAGIPGTAVGPLGHPETWDKGIDDLDARCKQAYAQGARFAKWRNVLQIDPAQGLPSDLAITLCVNNLAQYAGELPSAVLGRLHAVVRAPCADYACLCVRACFRQLFASATAWCRSWSPRSCPMATMTSTRARSPPSECWWRSSPRSRRTAATSRARSSSPIWSRMG